MKLLVILLDQESGYINKRKIEATVIFSVYTIVLTEDKDSGVTTLHGEMVRIKKNIYKIWGMQYSVFVPGDYVVISGEWHMTDCNNAVGNYLVSYYTEDPFHDDTVTPLWPPFPMVNQYDRMPIIDDSSNF